MMMIRRTFFILIILIFVITEASKPQEEISAVEIEKYYTETKIVGDVNLQEQCSDDVLRRREKAREDGTISLGVTPTVGLGAALLIFLGVGVFAVGIAQAFQMVRKFVYHDADNLDTAFDAGEKEDRIEKD